MTDYRIRDRFRGFLPVIIDVETAGFNAETDALLEIAAVLVTHDEQSGWRRLETLSYHVQPFPGAHLNPEALEFNKIDPFHPFRAAVDEADALQPIFSRVEEEIKHASCTRAILVGHNATFDLSFVKAASARCRLKRFPFHRFSTFDTAALSGVCYGQTVLARAVKAAGLAWNQSAAHSAIYDAERTADLFCAIVNRWDDLQTAATQKD